MTTKVAINGFGRIGRNILRLFYTEERRAPFEIVAINDLTDTATLAHLLKYDSVHRRFPIPVSVTGDSLVIGSQSVATSAERDPSKLKWGDLGVDVVLECSGAFTSREKAAAHLAAGAKKVIISAPSSDADVTIAFGVNTEAYDHSAHDVLSCASCTTNCLAPVAKVILDNFGISRGTMTTIHSYTNDQNILDLPHKDLRRSRAAALSMIPTTTGAAKAVGLVIPALKGKVDGFAVRVPTANVSLTDFVAEVERDTTREEVNQALKSASEDSLKQILGYSDEPLVSVDYIGDTHSSVVDSQMTLVVGKRLVKVIAWYDNEMGFSQRMIDVTSLISQNLS